jgi:hypothetical protein
MNKTNLYNRGQSFIGIIIVIIVVLLIGGGLFFYLNSRKPSGEKPEQIIQDKTADWKSYKDEQEIFEVKYPKDWTASASKYLVTFSPEGASSQIFVASHILALEEETKCNPAFLEDIGLRIVGQETINNVKFCKVSLESKGEILQTYYNVIKENNAIGNIGDTVYDIGAYHPDEGKLVILKQMLSTFKLLK